MERVQEAIAKARKERGVRVNERFGDAHLCENRETFSEKWRLKKCKINAYDSPVGDIQYTQTRVVPVSETLLAEQNVIAGFANDDRADVYRELRSKLLFQMKNKNWNTLAITSALSGEGKTLTAVNLAISLSQDVNQTILLVDLNLRAPSVHTKLGFEVEKGLSDYFVNDEAIENLLVNPGFERLVILPGRTQSSNTSELLTSPRMKMLLNELKWRYKNRIILFDIPALLDHDDAMVFIPQVDATVLVVEDRKTTVEQIKRCQSLLDQGNLIGTILNKTRV